VDASDHVFATQHANSMRRAREAHLKTGVAREEHLVARLDGGDVRAHGGDDPAVHLGRLVRRDDQTARKLRLVELLDDEMVVQRLERCVSEWLPFQQRFTILRACRSAATTFR
jgi:hypothetical protein